MDERFRGGMGMKWGVGVSVERGEAGMEGWGRGARAENGDWGGGEKLPWFGTSTYHNIRACLNQVIIIIASIQSNYKHFRLFYHEQTKMQASNRLKRY